ncbi:hypothetical protein J4447_04510 [Candidatus Pacearchaeota archaeon]|nr:hypothetical protein [Candidatus Pacearchaeota archaeon]
MNFSDFLKDLRLNKARNIVIYASFIILIISLLFPLQKIDNLLVQKASFSFLIYGVYLWFIERIIQVLIEQSREDWEAIIAGVFWIFLIIAGFIVTWKLVFGYNLAHVIFESNSTDITAMANNLSKS